MMYYICQIRPRATQNPPPPLFFMYLDDFLLFSLSLQSIDVIHEHCLGQEDVLDCMASAYFPSNDSVWYL
jgi:hypothetical protein